MGALTLQVTGLERSFHIEIFPVTRHRLVKFRTRDSRLVGNASQAT